MIYVDTSVVVALLTAEPATDKITAWFSALRETPVSADWLLPEFSSALSIKVRTGQFSEAHLAPIHEEFRFLVSHGVRLVPVSRAAFDAAAEMTKAHVHGLRAGDSLHLAVAREIGAESIATLDTTLARNAARMDIAPVAF